MAGDPADDAADAGGDSHTHPETALGLVGEFKKLVNLGFHLVHLLVHYLDPFPQYAVLHWIDFSILERHYYYLDKAF